MKICAIVVTYNPNIVEFLKYYKQNAKEVDYTIIIDNSEDSVVRKKIQKLTTGVSTEVIQLDSNKGIAYAQNRGLHRAKELDDFSFVLFLDQDSLLQKDMISIYNNYYEKLKNQYKIAVLGVSNTQKFNNDYLAVNQIISSGAFTPLTVFQDIGYFDEDLFIDFVEYDWCWRAKANGYEIFSIRECKLLTHMHGDGKINILGTSMVKPSSIRLYYQYRNLLTLLKRSYVPLKWKISMSVKMLVKIPIYIFLLKDKQTIIKYIFRGFRDSLFKKDGKYID
jgi:rhamnosyltransferase